MCATFQIFSDDEVEDLRNICNQIQKKYGDEAVAKYTHSDFYPKSLVPVIDPNNDVTLLKWGFPMSGKSEVIFNARAESLNEKPIYKNCLTNRCLILATAFYEWSKAENKRKVQISLADETFFYLAGLWKTYQNADGNKETYFTIITTEPSEQMKAIHHRMPAIITKEYAPLWLSNYWVDACGLLRPYERELKII